MQTKTARHRRQIGRQIGRHWGTFEAEAGGLDPGARLHAAVVILASAAAAAATAGEPAGAFTRFLSVCPHLQAGRQAGGTW